MRQLIRFLPNEHKVELPTVAPVQRFSSMYFLSLLHLFLCLVLVPSVCASLRKNLRTYFLCLTRPPGHQLAWHPERRVQVSFKFFLPPTQFREALKFDPTRLVGSSVIIDGPYIVFCRAAAVTGGRQRRPSTVFPLRVCASHGSFPPPPPLCFNLFRRLIFDFVRRYFSLRRFSCGRPRISLFFF